MTKTLLTLIVLLLCFIPAMPLCAGIQGCYACSTDETFCYSCEPGYSYYGGTCSKNTCTDSNCDLCDKGGECFKCAVTFEVGPGSNCLAITCGANCAACVDSSTCVRCSPNFTLNNGQCQWWSMTLLKLFNSNLLQFSKKICPQSNKFSQWE